MTPARYNEGKGRNNDLPTRQMIGRTVRNDATGQDKVFLGFGHSAWNDV
jgi:hypothetical protein